MPNEPNNVAARHRKEASREPLGADNQVTFLEHRRASRRRPKPTPVEHVNTPGHYHSLAQNGVDVELTAGDDIYRAWCESHAQEPITRRAD